MIDPLLLPRHALRLEIAQAADPESVERFVGCFRSAWRKIPPAPKRALLRGWRNWLRISTAKLLGRPLYRGVCVAADLPENTPGMCDSARLFFDINQLDQCDDSTIELVVGHEIAHGYLACALESPTGGTFGMQGADYWDDEQERRVRELTTLWSFKLLTPTIKPAPVTEAQAHRFIV